MITYDDFKEVAEVYCSLSNVRFPWILSYEGIPELNIDDDFLVLTCKETDIQIIFGKYILEKCKNCYKCVPIIRVKTISNDIEENYQITSKFQLVNLINEYTIYDYKNV